MSDTKAFQLRMPTEVFEAVQAHASLVGESMNSVIVAAIKAHFAALAQSDEFERVMQSVRTNYRVALDKLADL